MVASATLESAGTMLQRVLAGDLRVQEVDSGGHRNP